MHTEEEARKKWCPEVRCVGGSDEVDPPQPRPPAANCHLNVGPSGLGLVRVPKYARCIASECMAWRWRRTTYGDEPARISLGYCGKAGAP